MKDNTAVLKINGLAGRLIEPRQQIPEERKKFSNGDLKTLIVPIIIEQFLTLLVGSEIGNL